MPGREPRYRAGHSVKILLFIGGVPVLRGVSDRLTPRFVIAATEHLHRRIARMSDRIRQLEDGLAVLQASHSQEPHPLLRDGLLVVDQDRLDEPAQESDDGEATPDVISAFGTMSISEQGISRFFGPTGASEGLLLVRAVFTDSKVYSLIQWLID